MSDAGSEGRVINPETVPSFPRGVRLRFDRVRDRWVLLAPETVLTMDETAVEVLRLIDGVRSVDAIVALLAEEFEAPVAEIRADVEALIRDLAEQGFLAT